MPHKRGSVTKTKPKILDVLNIEVDSWFNAIQHFRRQYANFSGSRLVGRLNKCAMF